MKNKLLFSLLAFYGFANAQGTWTQKTDFGGVARWGAVAFSIGTKGYIGTGNVGAVGNYKKDFWEWNQVTDTWTQMADFGGTARYAAVGFSIGTKGYIGTGEFSISSPYYENDFWEWEGNAASPNYNTWTQKTNVGGTARCYAVGFSIGTKGYIGTGYSVVGGWKKDFWEWNQTTDTWIQKTDFGGVARGGAIAFSIGTKGYIGTGWDGNTHKDFWEWDQATDTWIQKATINLGVWGRESAVGFSIGTKGYFGTGDNGSTVQKDFWEWDQASDTWIQITNFGGTARNWARGFSIGNKGYIGTGDENIGDKKDFWEFYDSTNTTSNDEIENKTRLSVFPNPFSSQTTLKIKNNLKNATLTIWNASAEQVKQIKNISGQTVTLERGNLPSGLYFVRLTEENKTIAVDKLVITDK